MRDDGGREHVAALRKNGTVWAWGHNNDGQVVSPYQPYQRSILTHALHRRRARF